MKNRNVLIVDDEKNIRLTLSQALEALDLKTETAVNGEEALEKLEEKDFGLILLDLKMPGIDGMEVLHQVRETRPDIRVIIITAHGTIESAVEAMKLGAVDFIQKPFTPKEIRELVSQVIDREKIEEQEVEDYDSYIELAKRYIWDNQLDDAIEHVRKAISIEAGRPEAFNLLGALMEIKVDIEEARKSYRTALVQDPTYNPAKENLERVTTSDWISKGDIVIEEKKEEE